MRAAGDLAPPPRPCRLAPRAGARLGRCRRLARGSSCVSALTLPFGLGARRAGSGRGAARWPGSASSAWACSRRCSSSRLVRDVAAARGCGGRRRSGPGAIDAGTLVAPSARAVAIAAVLGHALGLRSTRAATRASYASTCRSPACRPRSTASRSRRSATSTSGRRSSGGYVEAIVATVNGLDADLVAVTGDLVDGSVAELAAHVAPLAGLRSRDGTLLRHRQPRVLLGRAAWVARAAPARPARC